ncbi:MAG: tetratricopeptide repeat protein, partial [Bacteroidota bacterium]
KNAFRKALDIDRNYGVAHLALANVLFAENEMLAASEHYELAIRNGEKAAYVYYNLGNTYYYMNEFVSASNNYKKAMEGDPKNPDYPYNLGLCYVKSGKLNAALEQFKFTTDLDDNYLEAHYNQGKVYFDLDDDMETMRIGNMLIEMDPDYGKGYLLMALVYNKRKDYGNMDKYLKLAKKLDPSLRL